MILENILNVIKINKLKLLILQAVAQIHHVFPLQIKMIYHVLPSKFLSFQSLFARCFAYRWFIARTLHSQILLSQAIVFLIIKIILIEHIQVWVTTYCLQSNFSVGVVIGDFDWIIVNVLWLIGLFAYWRAMTFILIQNINISINLSLEYVQTSAD